MSQELVSWGIHWYNNGTCHPALIQSGIVRDGEGQVTQVNLIQSDSINLGVIVPTLRNNVLADESAPYGNNTFHFPSGCQTE